MSKLNTRSLMRELNEPPKLIVDIDPATQKQVTEEKAKTEEKVKPKKNVNTEKKVTRKQEVIFDCDPNVLPASAVAMLQNAFAKLPVVLSMTPSETPLPRMGGYLHVHLPLKLNKTKRYLRIAEVLQQVFIKSFERTHEACRGHLNFTLHVSDKKGVLHCLLNTKLSGENFENMVHSLLEDNRLRSMEEGTHYLTYSKEKKWKRFTPNQWRDDQVINVKHRQTDFDRALMHTQNNKNELTKSALAACLCCKRTFAPALIKQWHRVGKGKTAACPACYGHSVVGSHSGLPVDDAEWLKSMNAFWDGRVMNLV